MKLNGNDRTDAADAVSRAPRAPIAVIGMGCMFPCAENLSSYWANIKGKVDAIIDVPESHWRPDDYFDPDPKAPDRVYARRGGFLSPVEFNPLDFGISPHTLEATDSTQLLGLVVAREALRDAGCLGARPFDRSRVSVILGVTGTLELVIPLGARLGHPIWRSALRDAGVDPETTEDVIERISAGYVPWQENSFPGLLGNVAAGRIASRLDLGGTNCVVDAACASSLGAMHLAAMELESGRCDMAVSGGLDTFNDIFMYMCFSKTPALSPSGHARPFDASGDGTTLGEGLGVVVLKRLEDAHRDGDRIYAVISGIGSSSDGKGNAIYAPSASGQAKALRAAYANSGVSPATVELVEAHGTGTKVGDATEVTALSEVYRSVKPDGTWCALGSVKSQIGHTKAAAGIAGIIKAILALHSKVLPPTIKVERPVEPAAPGKSPFYVNTEKRPWLPRAGHPRRAAVSAFGFGGSNFHCVLEEAARIKTAPDWDGDVQITAFSADSAADLERTIAAWPADEAAKSWHALRAAAAAARAAFDAKRAFRLLLVAERGRTDLKKLSASASALVKQAGSRRSASTPDGAYFGSSPRGNAGAGAGTGMGPSKLAFLFPGQGSQYAGMMRDVVCQFPEALAVLEDADLYFSDGSEAEHGNRLSDHIFPLPGFTDEARAAAESALRDTAVAQPALGAVSIAAIRVLARFAIEPDFAAGHSFGELTALAGAGWIDTPSFHRLARLRGKLMAGDDAPGARRDRGAMAAVSAPLEDVERWMAGQRDADGADRLVIANRNAPEQAVISGPSGKVEAFCRDIEARGVRTRRLPVSSAFHSPLVAAASRPFGEALRGVVFAPQRVPVFSNTTARAYPEDPEAARALLAGQLARPVEFAEEVRQLHAAGARTFVEVGPSNKLTGLVSSILAGKDHHAIAIDASSGKASGILDLAKALAHLAALGHPVDLKRWDEGYDPAAAPPAAKPGVTVALSGANYEKPRPAKPPVIRGTAPPSAPLSNRPSPEAATAPSPASPIRARPDPAARDALRGVDETLAALVRMQRETADLHRRFLEGQEAAQKSIQSLIEAQQRISLPAESAHSGLPASAPAASPAPVAAAPAPASGAGFQPARAPTRNPTAPILLSVIAEKTGYPAEMLSLDMSLDADLGIDSIKRVEIFSALREQLPAAPEVTPADLPSLRTLRAIADFLDGTDASPSGAGFQPARLPTCDSANSALPAAAPILLSVIAEKTGYPAEMLSLDMSLDADLGIDSIKRVEIFSALREQLPAAPEVTPADLPSLRTLRAIADFLDGTDASPSGAGFQPARAPTHDPSLFEPLDRRVLTVAPLGDAPRERLRFAPDSPIWIAGEEAGLGMHVAAALRAMRLEATCGSFERLRAAPVPEGLAGLVILLPPRTEEAAASVLWGALEILQRAGRALRSTARGGMAMLLGVTRLDGSFGLARGDCAAGSNPALGGLAGIVKTAAREWPEVHAKAIDLSPGLGDGAVAAGALVAEALIRGPIEVGIAADGSRCLELEALPLSVETPAVPLAGPGDVVVVTGGARGVTAEAAVALAEGWRVHLLLLGRSPLPEPEPSWLSSLDGEAAIKKAILTHSASHATPRAVGDECRRILAGREMLRTFSRIEAAGARVMYRSADVRDAQAVIAAFEEARRTLGPVRGIVHGAGVLADRRIEEKTREQLEEVFSTKVEGLRAILEASTGDDLRFLALFSSSTGRFGRIGQADYAAANEALNKIAQLEACRRPACRVVSVSWGPWEGGMVTPGLRRVFEEEGVGLIPLRAGARHLVHELCARGRGDVEVVVMGKLARTHDAASSAAEPAVPAIPTVPAIDESPRQRADGEQGEERGRSSYTIELSVDRFPILRSHVMNGKAVVPAALIVEWLAHGALHEHPGLAFQGFDGFKIFKGLILGNEGSMTLRVVAGEPEAGGGVERVPVELWSGGPEKSRLHARAAIVLGTERPPAPRFAAEPPLALYSEPGPVYDGQRLFHGAELQAIERVEGLSEDGIAAFARTSPPPAGWIRHPLRGAWLADPLALDAAFQLLILWSFANRSAGSLPSGVASYRQFQRAFPRDGVRIVVQMTRAGAQTAEASIDFVSRTGELVARIEGCECVIDASLEAAFARNRLEEAETV